MLEKSDEWLLVCRRSKDVQELVGFYNYRIHIYLLIFLFLIKRTIKVFEPWEVMSYVRISFHKVGYLRVSITVTYHYHPYLDGNSGWGLQIWKVLLFSEESLRPCVLGYRNHYGTLKRKHLPHELGIKNVETSASWKLCQIDFGQSFCIRAGLCVGAQSLVNIIVDEDP